MPAYSDISDNPGQPHQRGPGAKSTREKPVLPILHNRLGVLSLPHVVPTYWNHCFLNSDAVSLFPLVDMTL